MRVTRSDAHPLEHSKDFHRISVHNLARHFGQDRFHAVISTRGGVEWGEDGKSALANIYETLKPGGMAFITVTTPTTLRANAQELGLPFFRHVNHGIILFKRL